ncbi:transglutaminase-like domain-containing protein [Microvirga soli]|uniref:transglutaminase-like domain-containing protein n=1 Tax=Microvirga soli TaxID=1854496 RepID=UPI00191F5FF0|nr:transglutaminase family protein [Microvirga soli]
MATIKKSLTADISVTNTDNQAGYVNLAVTVPVSHDAQQKLVDILSDEGWALEHHDNGDAYLSRKQYINAGQTYRDKIDFRVDVNDYSLDFTQKTPGESMSASDRTKYMSPEKLVESNNPTIVKIANEIKAEHPGDVWAQAKEAYDYPIENFSYENMSQNKGAAWAVSNSGGDCTEYAATTAALLKAMGIPAKMVNVFWGGTDGELQDANFPTHARLKAFLPDRDSSGSHWHILDPQLGANSKRFDYGFGFGSSDSVDYNHGAWTYSAVAAQSGVGRFSTDLSYSLIDL